jgi:hypothetical protein
MGNEISTEKFGNPTSIEAADMLANAMSCGGNDCVPAYKGVDRERLKMGNPNAEPVGTYIPQYEAVFTGKSNSAVGALQLFTMHLTQPFWSRYSVMPRCVQT